MWCEGEVSPWEPAAVWRAPQPVERAGEGSEFTAALLSGRVWAVGGFPWWHEEDRSGGRVADSSRPLVPCVHWGGTRKRREDGGCDKHWWDGQDEQQGIKSLQWIHQQLCKMNKRQAVVPADHTRDLNQQFPLRALSGNCVLNEVVWNARYRF